MGKTVNQDVWEFVIAKGQILFKFWSHFPPCKQGKQQKVDNITTVTFTNIGLVFLVILQLKGYLRYKTITFQNMSSQAQIKNFFIS